MCPGTLEIKNLGLSPYEESLQIQKELVASRRSGGVPDQLLLQEHPHVITMGKSAPEEHIIMTKEQLDDHGIRVFHVGRGGDVTYHGPGQLVGYPILDLKPDRKDLHRYLRDLEEVLIRSLSALSVRARRRDNLTGVWVEDRKIAAIGVRVSSQWITSHGFSLNVRNDLSYFETIVPCGIKNVEVTSISNELGEWVEVDMVSEIVIEEFSRIFELKVDKRLTDNAF